MRPRSLRVATVLINRTLSLESTRHVVNSFRLLGFLLVDNAVLVLVGNSNQYVGHVARVYIVFSLNQMLMRNILHSFVYSNYICLSFFVEWANHTALFRVTPSENDGLLGDHIA